VEAVGASVLDGRLGTAGYAPGLCLTDEQRQQRSERRREAKAVKPRHRITRTYLRSLQWRARIASRREGQLLHPAAPAQAGQHEAAGDGHAGEDKQRQLDQDRGQGASHQT
jgi:hypothetical protein